MTKRLTGTLISDPVTGLLYFSPHVYRDGAEAFRARREDFRHVEHDRAFLTELKDQLAAAGLAAPTSAGEYVELD